MADFGDFSPHANIGYVYRRAELQNDAVLATVGFDHLMASWAMIAVDLVSELQVGENSLVLPQPLIVDEPFVRVINPTTIPDVRDDIVNASVGMKFVTGSGLTIIVNSIWPLNDGSLRPHVMWTAGLECSFWSVSYRRVRVVTCRATLCDVFRCDSGGCRYRFGRHVKRNLGEVPPPCRAPSTNWFWR